MTETYTRWASVLSDLTPDEAVWIAANIDRADTAWSNESGKALFTYRWTESSRSLLFYSDDDSDLEATGEFLTAFIKLFRPDFVFTIEYAKFCLKTVPGEFGGGVLVASRLGYEVVTTYELAERESMRERELLDEDISSEGNGTS